jgi:hypothetical protein
MIGADTGKWYVHDGKQWVQALPPGARPVAPPPPEIGVPRARGANNALTFAIGVIGAICLIGAVGVLLASSQGILKISLVHL